MGAMVSRGFNVALAVLRIAAGLSLLLSGLHKLTWFTHPEALEQIFTGWSQHPANGFVAWYLAVVTPHFSGLARLVVIGELGLGALLIAGFLTPLASLLAFLMVLSFQLGSGEIFSLKYLTGEAPLVYLLVFPVLMAGRAGTVLGVDGALSGIRSGSRPAG